MTFQACELWIEPACGHVCSWKHWFLIDVILQQSTERHRKSQSETFRLHSAACVDCKFTGTSEICWFRSESWEYWCHWCFFNSPLTRFCAEQKRPEEINATSNIRKHRFAEIQKAFCVNFDEISGQKLEIFFGVTWSLSPVGWILCTRLLNVQENTFILFSRMRPGMCALPTGALFLWQFEILTSMPRTPARLRAARGRVTHCYSSCFSSSLFLAFTFWFIHGSDLKSRSFVLEEAPGEDLHLQCRQGVSSDPTLFMFHPVLVCLSVLIRVLLARQHAAPLQLLQENPEVLLLQHHPGLPQSKQIGIHAHMEVWLKLRNPPTLHEVYIFMIVNFY